MNVFELFATLTLKTDEYDKKLDDSKDKASSFGESLKSGLATASKVGIAALTAASGAVVALTKSAVDNYAQYEQLVGGVETLFKGSADKVQEYASNAFKTAGLSSNEYMETVTSFSASLLQSLSGDTQKAAQVADQAITDMSDNANKMGTDMASIQNAYQGFAKQNYTMLDNLKLGYGGTKEEMERLIKDAESMSDTFSVAHEKTKSGADKIKYSYADVIEAIHIVQDNMGITGTTAAEASDTISGSFGSVKAAWENLLTGIADDNANFGQLINNFVDSVSTVGENIMPVIERTLSGIGTLIESLAPVLAERLPTIVEDVTPKLISAAATLVTAFGNALIQSFPAIATSIGTAIDSIFSSVGLNTNFSGLISDAISLISSAISKFSEISASSADGVKNAWEGIRNVFQKVADFLSPTLNKVSEFAKSTMELLGAMVDFVSGRIENFISKNKPIIDFFLIEIKTGINLALTTIKSIFQTTFDFIKDVIVTAFNYTKNIVSGAMDTITGIFRTVAALLRGDFAGAWENLKNTISVTIKNIVNLITNLGGDIKNVFSNLGKNAVEWGKNILTGLWNGISDKIAWLKSQVSGVVDKIKSWFVGKEGFDEHSPSKWAAQVGAFVSEGLAQGIESKKSEAQKKAEELAKSVYSSLKSWADKQVKYQELSLQEQIELWEEIQRQYAIGTEQYADAEDKLFDLRKQRAKEQEQLVKDTYSAVKSWIDKETKYRELSTETQIHMWEQVQGQFETGSEQWNDAEDKLFDLRKQRLKEQEQAEQDFSKKVEDVYKNIEDLEKSYAKELESRVQQIFNTYKLFDAVPERQEVSGRELINNLQGQIANIEEFYAKVQELSDRGVGDGLVESIRAMGPSAIDQLSALLSLTEDELNEYAGLFAEKQELANSLAVEQLQGLREKTDQQIQENMDSLSGIMQSVVDESASWGSDLISNFIGGIKEMESELTYAVAEAAQLVRDYLGFSEPKKGPLSNFHTYAPDMMQLFADGIKGSESVVANQINKSFDFGTRIVDFAASSLGRSSFGGASGYAMPELPQIVFETSGDIGQIVRLLHPRLRWEDKRVGRSLVNV